MCFGVLKCEVEGARGRCLLLMEIVVGLQERETAVKKELNPN